MIGAVLDQLVGQLPILFVAVAGAVVAIVMIQRTRVSTVRRLRAEPAPPRPATAR